MKSTPTSNITLNYRSNMLETRNTVNSKVQVGSLYIYVHCVTDRPQNEHNKRNLFSLEFAL